MSLFELEIRSSLFLNDPSLKNEEKMLVTCIKMILKDEEVIIDGKKVVGGVDPSILESEDDHRQYINIYTSKTKFEECQAKQAFVVKITDLLSDMMDKEKFGGISINYKKKEECVLIPKELILESLIRYKDNA